MSTTIDTVALATEAEEIRQALARKEHDPEARLAEIEQQLEEHHEREHERLMEAQSDFERVLAEYLPAQAAADEATAQLVNAVTRAVEARRVLEATRKRAGCGVPAKASVRASRDRELRLLRQEARLAAGADY